MNRKFKLQVEERKNKYKTGLRIVVVETINDPFTPLPKVLKGTVISVDDLGSVHTHWDNGTKLAALLEDKIELINKLDGE